MGIIYIISALILITSTMLINKTDKKENFLVNATITIVLYLCYNVVICFILDTIKIPIRLEILSAINVICTTIIIAIIIKSKKIQHYTWGKTDTVFLIVLACVQIPLLTNQFGLCDNIKYFTTDSDIHFMAAKEFSENEVLLVDETKFQTGKQFMPFSYINDGLLLKAIPISEPMDMYKIFIAADIGLYLLAGFTLYSILRDKMRNKGKFASEILIVLTILYMLGYPLNVLLTGFHYLNAGILIVTAIILYMQKCKEKNIPLYQKRIVLFIFNFGIMFAYNLFAPVVYITEFIYFIYETKKNEKRLLTKQSIITILLTLVLPGCMGIYFYFVLPVLVSNMHISAKNPLGTEGYVYRNYWSTIILLFPFTIYFINEKINKKEMDFSLMFVLGTFIYTILLLILHKAEIISSYYYFKIYYMLWIVLFLANAEAIIEFGEKKKENQYCAKLVVSAYIAILVISLITKDCTISKTFEKEGIDTIMGIYDLNKAQIEMVPTILTKNEVDTIKHIKNEKIVDSDNVLLIGTQLQAQWIQKITGFAMQEGDIDQVDYNKELEKWENNEFDYMLIAKRSYLYNALENLISYENSEIVYNSDTIQAIRKVR